MTDPRTTVAVITHNRRAEPARILDRLAELPERPAPDVWVELCPDDARARGIRDGDLVRVTSRRGELAAPAPLIGHRPGVVSVPFHYGYFDQTHPHRHTCAANELTRDFWPTAWSTPKASASPTVCPRRVGSGPGLRSPVRRRRGGGRTGCPCGGPP